MTTRRALVTRATSGVGLATARLIHARGSVWSIDGGTTAF